MTVKLPDGVSVIHQSRHQIAGRDYQKEAFEIAPFRLSIRGSNSYGYPYAATSHQRGYQFDCEIWTPWIYATTFAQEIRLACAPQHIDLSGSLCELPLPHVWYHKPGSRYYGNKTGYVCQMPQRDDYDPKVKSGWQYVQYYFSSRSRYFGALTQIPPELVSPISFSSQQYPFDEPDDIHGAPIAPVMEKWEKLSADEVLAITFSPLYQAQARRAATLDDWIKEIL